MQQAHPLGIINQNRIKLNREDECVLWNPLCVCKLYIFLSFQILLQYQTWYICVAREDEDRMKKGRDRGRDERREATRRIEPSDRKWYEPAYGQTAEVAARRGTARRGQLPIAHVICTYQYEPCQIYHSARYTRTRFRAASPPAANFIQFPVFRRCAGVACAA